MCAFIIICDSSAVLNSIATDTQINIPVALNAPEVAFAGSIRLSTTVGISASNARKIAPNRVNLSFIFLR